MQVEVNSYQDIGDYLREVRESLGLDPRDIGQQLNIRSKYLVALEEGHINVMPGKVYARGYLMNYAEYLGLNKNEIAEAFDRMDEQGSGKTHYFVPEPTNRTYQPGMMIVGLALMVTLVVYYYWYKNHTEATPLDYEMVSPVPERMLDPILQDTEVQENDDIYVDPMLPPDSLLQGDGNVAVGSGESLPENAAVPEVVEPTPSTVQAKPKKLPWLAKPEGATQ